MLSFKSGMNSPFGFELDKNIGGESVDEQIYNTFVRNEGGTATATSPMICTPPEVTIPNLRDFANALQEHTNVVSNLVQSVEGLTAAIKLMKDKKIVQRNMCFHESTQQKIDEIQGLRY